MSQEKIKILIIEDSEFDLLIYRELLEGTNLEVFEAMNYEQAESMFLARTPDVLIVDYNLAGISAPEVIEKLTELSPLKRVCSIVLTSFGSEDTVKNSLKAGAKDYLSKDTLTKEILLGSINSAFEIFKEEDSIIQEQNKLESALVKAKGTMEQNNEFLASVAHELRTPLNGVIGFLGLLKEKNIKKEKQEEYINLARVSASHLLNLVNDLLDFSKIEANKFDIELVKFNVADVINNSCSICSTQIEAKNIVLAIDVDDNLLKNYYGDPSRLQQIFINLISNAIKFTPKSGAIMVTASKEVSNSDDNQDQIIFAISDTGIGIPKNKTDKIFSAYTQAESSTSREYGGTGLGLSIVTKLIELMKGNIWVESQEGIGSSFKFSLNLKKAGKLEDNKHDLEQCSATVSGKHILLAEDNEINCKLFKILLEKMGHKVSIVDNGEDAIDFALNNEIDILFMDIQMPKMNGLVASQEIRKKEKSKNRKRVPIVALTANANEFKDGRCQDAGMDSVLGKPIDKEAVKTTIKKLCT